MHSIRQGHVFVVVPVNQLLVVPLPMPLPVPTLPVLLSLHVPVVKVHSHVLIWAPPVVPVTKVVMPVRVMTVVTRFPAPISVSIQAAVPNVLAHVQPPCLPATPVVNVVTVSGLLVFFPPAASVISYVFVQVMFVQLVLQPLHLNQPILQNLPILRDLPTHRL